VRETRPERRARALSFTSAAEAEQRLDSQSFAFFSQLARREKTLVLTDGRQCCVEVAARHRLPRRLQYLQLFGVRFNVAHCFCGSNRSDLVQMRYVYRLSTR